MSLGKTLYVTDLDGTLLNDESQISTFSRQMLNRLASEGASITFATARTPATVVQIFDGVKLNVPGIVMTGAATYDISTRIYSNKRFLDDTVAQKVLEVYSKAGLSPFVYTWHSDNILHAYHGKDMTDAEKAFYEIRRDTGLKRFHIGESLSDEELKHVLLIFAVGNRQRLKALVPELEEAAGYKISYYNDIFFDENGFIEVFARDVTKARAILKLKEEYGFERVVAFGDNLNDVSMFEVADVGIAVENAFDEVKLKADVIIPSNITDAVVKYIDFDFHGRDKMADVTVN